MVKWHAKVSRGWSGASFFFLGCFISLRGTIEHKGTQKDAGSLERKLSLHVLAQLAPHASAFLVGPCGCPFDGREVPTRTNKVGKGTGKGCETAMHAWSAFYSNEMMLRDYPWIVLF